MTKVNEVCLAFGRARLVGEVSERLNELVSKTSVSFGHRGFKSPPHRHPSAWGAPLGPLRRAKVPGCVCGKLIVVIRTRGFAALAAAPRVSVKGEVSEWLKEHAWKACVWVTAPRVQIPPSPPLHLEHPWEPRERTEISKAVLDVASATTAGAFEISVHSRGSQGHSKRSGTALRACHRQRERGARPCGRALGRLEAGDCRLETGGDWFWGGLDNLNFTARAAVGPGPCDRPGLNRVRPGTEQP